MNINEFPKKEFCLEVSGEYAMFTIPTFKAEKISYDIPTSGAVRGIFSSILWKPAIRYIPKKLEVINPIKYDNCTTNGYKNLSSSKNRERDQYHATYLKDVKYRMYADLVYIPEEYRENVKEGENPTKYFEMFHRRTTNIEQRFKDVCLGTSECSCDFRLITDFSNLEKPIQKSEFFGKMYLDSYYDEDWTEEEKKIFEECFKKHNLKNQYYLKRTKDNKKVKKLKPERLFCDVVMNNGVVLYENKYSLKADKFKEIINKLK